MTPPTRKDRRSHRPKAMAATVSSLLLLGSLASTGSAVENTPSAAPWVDRAEDVSSDTSAPLSVVPEASGAVPSGSVGTAIAKGSSTWYCNDDPRWRISRCPRGHGPDEHIAAINAAVVDIPFGTIVAVSYGTRRTLVKIVDHCGVGCSVLIDLSRVAFGDLSDPSRGRINVTIEWGGDLVKPPATDVAP